MVWRDRRNTFATSAWTSRAHAAQKHWKNAEKSEVTINWWYGKTDMKTRPYRAMGPKTRSFPIFRSGGWLGCRIFVSFQAKHPNISWITAVGIWCCIVGLTKNLWLLSLVSLDGPGCLACVSSNPQPPRTIFPKQKKNKHSRKTTSQAAPRRQRNLWELWLCLRGNPSSRNIWTAAQHICWPKNVHPSIQV